MRDFSVGNLITSYRTRLGLKQNEVVNPDDPELLSVTLRTYQGWENGERIPSNKWLHRIASFFYLTDTEADELYRAAAQVAPEIDNLPFRRNPLFAGRKTYLERLDQLLKENGTAALAQPISISGLGGIGKTQIALEYAHRNHPTAYRTVLWANAANKVTLEESYLSLAQLLNLPEKDEHDIHLTIQAVKTWLKEHTGWLLILDNVDDLQLASSFLPIKNRGHILLTTRSQNVGHIAVPIEIERMESEEGLLFLLRRSGLLKTGMSTEMLAHSVREAAAQIVEHLDGHPLALDQAGAYIEENNESFEQYLKLYHEYRHILLSERGTLGEQHPDSVTITFRLCFKRVQERYPATKEVLEMCAFLHPDAIPEEIFQAEIDAIGLDNVIALNKAIAALRAYSLLHVYQRQGMQGRVFSIHRLVQAVIHDEMDTVAKSQRAECMVDLMLQIFPREAQDSSKWVLYEHLLPHVQQGIYWAKTYQVESVRVGLLLNNLGLYLAERGRYSDAESSYLDGISICNEKREGNIHILSNLAVLYSLQAKYEDAEKVMREIISCCEKHSYEKQPFYEDLFARNCNNLSHVYWLQGRFQEAEFYLKRAFNDRLYKLAFQDVLGLNNLAMLYKEQGKYSEADFLIQQALTVCEQEKGSDNLYTATCLHNQAEIHRAQGKIPEAASIHERALSIRKKHLGDEHPLTLSTMGNLALSYAEMKMYKKAEPLFKYVLTESERQLGPDHPQTAMSECGLATFYIAQDNYQEAEKLLKHALQIAVDVFGDLHLFTKTVCQKYTITLFKLKKYDQCRAMMNLFPRMLEK